MFFIIYKVYDDFIINLLIYHSIITSTKYQINIILMRLLFCSVYMCFFKNLYLREEIEQKAMKMSISQKTAAHTLQSHNNILLS